MIKDKIATKVKRASSRGFTSSFTLQNTIDAIDLFKKNLPTFNMKGKTHVPSYFGAFMSVLVALIVTLYGLTKFIQLTSKHNPNVSSWVEQGAVTSETILDFKEEGFNIAFGVEGYLDKEIKDDERYVKFFTRLVTQRGGIQSETIIPSKRCSTEDFALFSPPIQSARGMFEEYKNGTRHLRCLDWDKI